MRMIRGNSPVAVLTVCASLAIGMQIARAGDDSDDNKSQRTSVAFGRGLNTAQPGNVVNHAILPRNIKVRLGGVVDFSVAGFHDIVVFKPGFKYSDLIDAGGGQLPLTAPIFVLPPDPSAPLPVALASLADKIYYRGINPAGGPLGTAVSGNPANGSNRGEVVAFLEKGTYLVICNVRPHTLDGMTALVRVD